MSNFGVTYLLKIYKGNNRLSIEDNIGEELHIHFGEMRLMLKNLQFREFAENSMDYISDITGLSLDVLNRLDPIFLFDLCRRGELPSLTLQQEEYISVGELLCPVQNMFGVWKYKPINKSHFLKVMRKKTDHTPYDEDQINYLGRTNLSRCNNILEMCKKNRKICDDYPLYVTKRNVIRDGQHRAAALYYLYGYQHKVKVQRMETNKSDHLYYKDKIEILKEIIHTYVNRIRKYKKKIQVNKKELSEYRKCVKRCLNKTVFDELKIDNKLKKEVYFVDKEFALSGFPVLIKKKNANVASIKELLIKHNLRINKGHSLVGVSFIYGLGEDCLLVDDNNHPVAFLQDKLSSYAMSVNSFMPYAPEIQRYLNSYDDVPKAILYILRLLKCMFDKEKQGFYKEDIEYFDEHISILKEKFFTYNGLIEKVLFGYSDRMIELLQNREYEKIIEDYRRFEY